MNYKRIVLLSSVAASLLWASNYFASGQEHCSTNYTIKSFDDVVAIFPKTVEQIKTLVEKAKKEAAGHVEEIVKLPHAERTFANTARALDRAWSFYFFIAVRICEALMMLFPDDALHNAAAEAEVELKQCAIDLFDQNIDLYKALKAYVDGNAKQEKLTDEQRYFLQETMAKFKRSGLELPKKERERVKALEKQLAQLCTEFAKNIDEDKTCVTVGRDELDGMEKDFVDNLGRSEDGAYILTMDYPTAFSVLDHCEVASTRKKVHDAFENRAFPVNAKILDELITCRDELAKLLGYESYAALNIESEMARTLDHARTFIENLSERIAEKETQEFKLLTKDLPPSVTLKDGKLWPWDIAFCQKYYKKKHCAVAEQEIKQYFPMEKTIEGLLDIYQQFFDVKFKQVPASGLWSDDLCVIEACREDVLLGYLILDLYPRPNKFSHAGEHGVIPALKTDDGRNTVVSIVAINFPKPTADKPSLLDPLNVRVFFHEFGHAIHELLGATELAFFAGTNVKTDFVEMPSQMLEEWLWDRASLKKMSSHYQTGDPLPDALLDKVLALKNCTSGYYVQRQTALALMAFNYFGPGAHKNVEQITYDIRSRVLPHIHASREDHFACSWIHVPEYGARYYGYLWSKVFSLDLFGQIKKLGLANPETGKRYIASVIGKGGSKDPNELLKDFLGREPNADAFFADLGL